MKGKEQSFWMGFGVIMVVLLGGSGFFFYTAHSKFSSSNSQYDALRNKLNKLQNASIYPSEDNVEEMSAVISSFEAEVDTLHNELKSFQRPLNMIPTTQFPQDLKQKILEFREYRLEERVVIPEDFYMGFAKYQFAEPEPGATGILDYQLQAVDHLLRLAIDSGADVIYALNREETAVERKEEDPEKTQRVVKYPITFSFRTSHEGFREFLNQVSNGKDYFYLVRVLRVDNEVKDGPTKDIQEQDIWVDKTTGEVITSDEAGLNGGDIDYSNLALQDAQIVMGNEKLKVTAVIDLCRFPEVNAGADQETLTKVP